MPRLKIDYVVSFSSEDPEHPAQNLLAWDVSKKKWLCKKGETSCSVVLQLTKAVKITSVHICAYHAALVEVLVARSEKGSEQYQVLVPSCVFVSPAESRRDLPVERVRSFSGEQLSTDARHQRWDRVRLVCSQPYNKHCKYGLSFIHIDEAGDEPQCTPIPALTAAPAPTPPAAVPARVFNIDTFSSDEDDFRPGELFASHLQASQSQTTPTDTGAQIRQATSKALKNISESSTKLTKTPISKPRSKRETTPTSEGRADRARENLLYTDDDEKPHAKIDLIVQRHNDHKHKEDKAKQEIRHKEEKAKQAEIRHKDDNAKQKEVKHREEKARHQEIKDRQKENNHKVKDESRTPKRRKSVSPANDTPPSKKANNNYGDASTSGHRNRTEDKKKRPQASSEDTEQVGEESTEPHTILQDVVLVLSGYQNPERANVRNVALAMGATVERDWSPRCTHLICAFPNTPKLRQVRASSGASVPVVTAQWVLQCSARRRRLPWRWFATEPHNKRPEPPAHTQTNTRAPASPARDDIDTDCDTDDEIEKVLQKQKAKQPVTPNNKKDASPKNNSKRPAATNNSSPKHEAKRLATIDNSSPKNEPKRPVVTDSPARKDHVTSEYEDFPTDEEDIQDVKVDRFGGALPDFLDGHTFVIDADDDAETLARYVTAYGGLVLQASQLDEDSEVDYVICGRARPRVDCAGAHVVRPAWLASCVREAKLLAPD